jgi:hypothetical protein
MKKKIFALSCIMLLLLFVIPTGNSQEIVKDTALNTMPIAHVVIKGNGTAFLVHGNFTAGIGRCWAMIVTLENDGHVEINKLFDTSNITVLEGSRVITLIGFIGYYYPQEGGINLNGVALLAVW